MPASEEPIEKVIEILAAVVDSGGEATGFHLNATCGLTRAQLERQLDWMEREDLINQVRSSGDGRIWGPGDRCGKGHAPPFTRRTLTSGPAT